MKRQKNNRSKRQSQARRKREEKLTNRRLLMESLDERALMAANIFYRGGTVTIAGSSVADNAEVSQNSRHVIVKLNDQVKKFSKSAVKKIRFFGHAGNDKFVNNTNIRSYARGGNGNDILIGGSNRDSLLGDAGHDILKGNAGNDRLYGGAGNDKLYGGGGNDKLYGQSGNDHLDGSKGHDQLFGGSGHDKLLGQAGNDRLHGNSGNDRLYGGSGNDRLYGNSGHDRLYGSSGNDRLYGGSGHDKLYGQAGHDKLYGGSGNDRLHGNSGNDRLYGNSGHDRLHGNSGNDRLYGNSGNDKLFGDSGHDRIYGSDGHDDIRGGSGNDYLRGGKGNDKIQGQAGNDTLRGDQGKDNLSGGDGADKIWGGSDNDWISGGLGNDFLRGGSGTDRLYGGGGQDNLDAENPQSREIREFTVQLSNDATLIVKGLLLQYANKSYVLVTDNPHVDIEQIGGILGKTAAGLPVLLTAEMAQKITSLIEAPDVTELVASNRLQDQAGLFTVVMSQDFLKEKLLGSLPALSGAFNSLGSTRPLAFGLFAKDVGGGFAANNMGLSLGDVQKHLLARQSKYMMGDVELLAGKAMVALEKAFDALLDLVGHEKPVPEWKNPRPQRGGGIRGTQLPPDMGQGGIQQGQLTSKAAAELKKQADAKTGKGGDDFTRDGEKIRQSSPPVFNKGIRQTPHNTTPQPESQGGSTGTLTDVKVNPGGSLGIGQFDPNSNPAPKVGNILDDRVQEMKKGGSGSNF